MVILCSGFRSPVRVSFLLCSIIAFVIICIKDPYATEHMFVVWNCVSIMDDV